MTPIWLPILGFAFVFWSSMLNRGAGTAWAHDEHFEDHDWRPDSERSFGSRIIGYVAGPPSFIVLVTGSIMMVGWWTPLVFIAGIVVSFVLNLMILGGSPMRVAQRMRSVRLPISILAIVTSLTSVVFA